MFDWLRSFIRREVIDDAPPELSLCEECGKLECSEGDFQACAQRKQRAAELVAAQDHVPPQP